MRIPVKAPTTERALFDREFEDLLRQVSELLRNHTDVQLHESSLITADTAPIGIQLPHQESPLNPKSSRQFPNRRVHSRKQVRFLAYVKLGSGNGGIVLNISKGGMAVQAVKPLIDPQVSHMRLQLSGSSNWVELSGQIAWLSESKKVAGIKFVGGPFDPRDRSKKWFNSESSSGAFMKETDAGGVEEKQLVSIAPSNKSSSPITQFFSAGLQVGKQTWDLISTPETATCLREASTSVLSSSPATQVSGTQSNSEHNLVEQPQTSHADHGAGHWGRWTVAALTIFFVLVSLAAGIAIRRRALEMRPANILETEQGRKNGPSGQRVHLQIGS